MVSTLLWPYGETEYQPPRMPKYSPRRYSVGVDLGQANDPTAIAVLERVMNLGESRIEMRISRSAWFPRDLRFPHSYAISNRVHNTL
jgi:hypothetical protein